MRAIITGSNSGLGFHTAVAFAKKNIEIVLAVRSLSRGNAAAHKIRAANPTACIEVSELDLSSLDSVARFVAGQESKGWDLLVNNAGAKIQRPFKQTREGFEWHTGVNHLGHFALTAGLWPARVDGAKVISVSSIVAKSATLNPESISRNTFDEGKAYADSKLLNLLFARNLSRLIDEKGLRASSIAAHPGFARAEPYGSIFTRIAEACFAQTAKRGAESIIQSAARSNGDYLAPRILQLWGDPRAIKWPEASADIHLLQHHWQEAERATGTKFVV